MSSTATTECFGALSIKYTGEYPSSNGEDKLEKQFKKVKSGVRPSNSDSCMMYILAHLQIRVDMGG